MSAPQDVLQVVDYIEKYDFFARLPWMRMDIWGNPIYHYFLTVLTFIAIWWALLGLRSLAVARFDALAVRQGSTHLALFRDLLREVRGYAFPAIAIYFASRRLELPALFSKYLMITCLAIIVIQVIRIVSEIVLFALARGKDSDSCDLAARSTNRNVGMLVKALLWAVGILFVLDNAGFNVGTFIAGLGIGGVAIALASQAILGDTFSSFAISLDKPFEPGDFIVVDDFQGTIEQIGLKTTRARSVNGEMLIFCNTDLCKSRVRNFKRMTERRVVTRIGITYDTSLENVKALPDVFRSILTSQEQVRVERVHFASYGDSALIYEMVYFVLSPAMKVSMDVQQEINFKIFEELAKRKISMAFPSRTVYVVPQKEESNQATVGGLS